MSLADIEDTSKVWGSANNGYFCVQYQLRNWEISFGNICIIWKKLKFLCPVLNVRIIWKYFHYLFFMWKNFVCPISELCIILKYQPSFEGENYINPFYPAPCQLEWWIIIFLCFRLCTMRWWSRWRYNGGDTTCQKMKDSLWFSDEQNDFLSVKILRRVQMMMMMVMVIMAHVFAPKERSVDTLF